ncbi:hypothetical protein PR048_023507 [Dryococelus australis]|uniref:Reverse transcriptase domain-containing protein n=1 Tax=Dryococelus australis TaxID=614101 RepID=A0ABQ9GUA8_9NEOP|nr:hypothetical protein PR048_023507 [Dryococelus australis]
MPFGLINAPSTFAKLMNDTLAGLIGQVCFAYLDDIVFSKTEKHISNLRLVFDKLRAANLKLKPENCNFMSNYLGHEISKDVKEIRQFIGLVGYYRRFIPSFSKIVQPLTELTKKDISFEWNELRENTFAELRKALCDKPVVKCPDISLPFFVTCGSSGTAMGAVLSQKINCSEHPTYYIYFTAPQ